MCRVIQNHILITLCYTLLLWSAIRWKPIFLKLCQIISLIHHKPVCTCVELADDSSCDQWWRSAIPCKPGAEWSMPWRQRVAADEHEVRCALRRRLWAISTPSFPTVTSRAYKYKHQTTISMLCSLQNWIIRRIPKMSKTDTKCYWKLPIQNHNQNTVPRCYGSVAPPTQAAVLESRRVFSRFLPENT